MRSDEQVVAFEERAVVRQRLHVRHVDTCGRYRAARERVIQRDLVHHRTTRGVDEDCGRLHLRQRLPVDQVARLRVRRGMNRDEIRLCKQGVHVDHLDAVQVARRLVQVRVIRQDARRREASNPRGECAADVAEPDDSDGLAGNAGEVFLMRAKGGDVVAPQLPHDAAVQHGDAPGQGQQQGHSVVGHLCRVHSRRIADADAELGRGLSVDRVDADAMPARGLQFRKCFQYTAGRERP